MSDGGLGNERDEGNRGFYHRPGRGSCVVFGRPERRFCLGGVVPVRTLDTIGRAATAECEREVAIIT
jgi:hypothetical protein